MGAKKNFIPIPPPAPLPQAEQLDPLSLLNGYLTGQIDLICVMGPTASGKTRLAVNLAKCFANAGHRAEILSADSRQVFAGMDIGTGKDLGDYEDVPYHLIDIVPAGSRFNICMYQKAFSEEYRSCLERGVVPILCGGSGLYVEAVTRAEYEMKEVSRAELCLPGKTYYLATLVDRETRRKRIDLRLDQRLEAGMVEEIKGLLDSGVESDMLIRYGLEYKFITLYLLGRLSYEQMHEQLRFAIHQFAKRQMTWLRGMEKDGIEIHWVNAEQNLTNL